MTRRIPCWLVILGLLGALPAIGQQTGSISGRVTMPDGSALPGVVVEASSTLLPRPRVATTGANGQFNLPLLPPGSYRLTFSLAGMESVSREIQVSLQQEAVVSVTMAPEAVDDEITVVGESPLIDFTTPEIKSSIDNDTFEMLPVGQEYRDLVKLIPGVQYTEETTRGPSAGGSGQDNVYQFDGVEVGLPLFGVLSAEPSSHDIAQVAVVKGGAKAVDFNRSGGFTIDTVSKSGTNQFRGEVKYQLQTEDMTGTRRTSDVAVTQFDEDRAWATFGIGGPVLQERLFFYASYFRPTVERDNRENVYGPVPDFKSTRDELFGKLTFTPTSSTLLHGSFRNSEREGRGSGVGGTSAATTSLGSEDTLRIGIAEGSWVISENSFASFKLTDFANKTSGRPDLIFDIPIRVDGSLGLDIANLDRQGRLRVPTFLTGETAYNEFVADLIERYGYLQDGQRVGDGFVGGGLQINDQDFFRQSFQAAYELLLGSRVTHEIRLGYQYSKDEEDLDRRSNGWGDITVPGGRTTFQGQPVFFQARFLQTGLHGPEGGTLLPSIKSEFESHSFEINDTIRWADFTFNVGVLLSNDIYYGQGLRPNPNNPVTGLEQAPGHRYKMHEIGFGDMIQPRLGAVWAYRPGSTLFANYARYNPAASSLPRAASWDRNLAAFRNAYFDAQGNLIGSDTLASSTGKWFQEGIKPRTVEEYLIGASQQITSRWVGRLYGRHRYGFRYWEDTNNDARVRFLPPDHIPRELYVPNLDQIRGEISGSTYVIAQLDDAFTRFYEAALETEWRGDGRFVRGSYVWSQYYGNFDQDNTTSDNDQAIFIGSSNLADGAGRQIWDNRYGRLRGDRRHQLKLYGFQHLPWNASAGAFAIYQSGQPWEAWDHRAFSHVPGISTSNVARFAEPAGSRRTSDHYQMDLNYTQSFSLGGPYTVQLIGDLFNVFDKQTGWDIQNQNLDSATFGQPRRFFAPRRFQLAVRFLF